MTDQLDVFDPALGSIPGFLSLERQHDRSLPDDEVRQRIREDLDASLFVEAAAGAGKTTALVSRIVSLIGAGRGELQNMVAVTYTNRAAGELKLRLRRDIEEARMASSDPDICDRFVTAVRQLEVAHIGTIHSFCGDLLRERPIEAGVDPLFRTLTDSEATHLLDQAFDNWFQRILQDPPEGVRRVLRRHPERIPGPGRRLRGPRQELRDAVGKLVEHRDFPSPWRRSEDFDYVKVMHRALQLLRELSRFAELTPRYANRHLARFLATIRQLVDDIDAREAGRPPAPESIEVLIRDLIRQRGWGYSGYGEWFDKAESHTLEEVKERRDSIQEELQQLLEAAEADLAARLREELRPAVDSYEELKRQEGVLDFVDLLLKARNLIRDNTEVRRGLQRRFSHYFVDEFQDTDPLQAEILLLLAADNSLETDFRRVRPARGKLFVVGDPKQSIYSFRRADVRIYEEIKERLSQHGTEVLRLTTSFRSVPAIQEVVNAVFSQSIRMVDDGSQPAYVPLECFRTAIDTQPAVIALPAPRIYSNHGKRVKYAISASYADAVGAFVRWLVEESGWKVTEPGRPDRLVAVRYRHICILSRRLQGHYEDVMRPYIQALEAREVPHVLVGGKGFHDREEVLALRNVLQAIEWPDDALSVYAALKGPFLAFTDGRLLAFRHRYGSLHPFVFSRRRHARPTTESTGTGVPFGEERELAEALSILASLHNGRNLQPIAQTISEFLSSVRAHAGLANWRAGEQVLANCLRIVDRARAFEANGSTSFRAFVELLEDEAKRGEGEEAPIIEEGTEGVRIMSVHRAKGLEFPVVILADPTYRATHSHPSRHIDPVQELWAEPLCGALPLDVLNNRETERAHDEAEAIRLAYVAATRARDLLVVPAIGEGEDLSGWVEFLNPAVYPQTGTRRSPSLEATIVPGCPSFGERTVLDGQVRSGPAPEDPAEIAVKPGLHTSRVGTPIVWWDPAALELGVAPATGMADYEILAADEGELLSAAGTRAYESWREGRRRIADEGAQPGARVVTARAMAAKRAAGAETLLPAHEMQSPVVSTEGSTGDLALAVEVRQIARGDDQRPSSARFGELVHRTLATVSLSASSADVRTVADMQARILGAPPGESAAAALTVEGALKDPLLMRATRGEADVAIHRETPVLLQEATGEIVEGVVDLAFRERSPDGGADWTIVEFKTDREIAGALTLYKEQVAMYAQAVEQATGEKARGVLLVI